MVPRLAAFPKLLDSPTLALRCRDERGGGASSSDSWVGRDGSFMDFARLTLAPSKGLNFSPICEA